MEELLQLEREHTENAYLAPPTNNLLVGSHYVVRAHVACRVRAHVVFLVAERPKTLGSVVQNGPNLPLASFVLGGGTVPFRTNGRTVPTAGRCVAHTPSPPPNGGGAHATPPSGIPPEGRND
eukprot:359760-Chlamydomonas_euryale.AAC.1